MKASAIVARLLRRSSSMRTAHAARACVVAIGFTLACTIALAATISGRVVDAGGQPLPKVMVTATHLETEFGGVAVTDNAGAFSIDDLPLGRYRVVAGSGIHLSRTLTVTLDSTPMAPLRIVLVAGFGGQVFALRGSGPKNYATVSVLYGTDRKPVSAQGAPLVFGAERGELVVGVCQVSIPRDHRIGELESPSVWKFEFRPDPSKHVALLSTTRMETAAFRALLAQRLKESGARSSLVFVHGFNVSFEDAARRTAQIAYDLGFRGVPSFYSWPSNGSALDYMADGEQARRAVRYLGEYLELVFADPQVDEVHLIAHSMGNRVLTAALQQLAAKRPAAARPKIGQIALVAPDIDAEVFRNEIAPQITGVGRRLTLYASTRDKALQLSKKLHNYPRAGDLGDVVTIVAGMDTIDASAVDTSFLGHSYFAENRSVIADLFALLRKDAAPSERFGMRPMTSAGRRYWQFAP